MNARSEKASNWEMAAVGAAFLAFCWWAVNWGIGGLVHSRKTVEVPDLKGHSVAAALDALSPLNLGLRKTGVEFDASVPIAAILRQQPPAGTIVREGKVIRVVLSQGGQTVLSPALDGLPLRNAEMLLRQSQLALGEVSEAYSLKSSKGLVLSQDPQSETSVEKNSLVNVVVSAGPPPAGVSLMPDFSRKTLDAVQSWASSAGLKVTVQTDATSLFPNGTVLEQSPAPDAALSTDTVVAVTVSGRKGALPASAKTFRYVLARGGASSQVRIVLVDKYGERELFDGVRGPGATIEVPVQSSGGARVRIYLNGILVEERDL
ncbi:MAG: PASTA domain-containing protein [Elusimicrobia bacterium]|nr:PASTA domain-containing protein [Elusimicrobiota bacterium]